jgi:crotonobetainyl-CoA:carnitine CoA-transferase CaiB-like acyl-CoA transferase
MAPHGIYPTDQEDRWVAIACRDDDDWLAFGKVCPEAWANDPRFSTGAARLDEQTLLDELVSSWTSQRSHVVLAGALRAAGVPAAPVAMSEDRIEHDPDNLAWGLFPTVHHPAMGDVRVDGIPAHLSETDWSLKRGAPLLGEHNREVFCGLLGLSEREFSALDEAGVF